MSDGYNIERLISFLFCSACGTSFDVNSIKVLEERNDTVIVKVECPYCKRKYALAFMDLSFPLFGMFTDGKETHEMFETPETPYEEEEEISLRKNSEKITYDDVLEAHDFIQNFEENWRRYLDKRKYKIT